MCNSNCGCNSAGCSLLNYFANAIDNLFSTQPYCGCNRPAPDLYTNGFVNGVNAANAVSGCGCNNQNGCGCNNNQNGCGCNNGNNGNNGVRPLSGNVPLTGGCGCGSNADLTPYTACNNQCFDAYYAQQYALYPFNTGSGVCSCCNN